MSLFVISDLHLPLGVDKPMDIFKGWDDYVYRIEKNWRAVVKETDTVVLAGDTSWAMNLEGAKKDFEFINSLPGKKIIVKGNHDYWWETKTKMDKFFKENGFESLNILFNNSYFVEGISICGTRGWFFDAESDSDKKVVMREVGRLKASLSEGKKLGGEVVVFLHYPPINKMQKCKEIYDTLLEENVKTCYYGHLHGLACREAVNEECDGIKFSLISSDYLEFCPKIIKK